MRVGIVSTKCCVSLSYDDWQVLTTNRLELISDLVRYSVVKESIDINLFTGLTFQIKESDKIAGVNNVLEWKYGIN